MSGNPWGYLAGIEWFEWHKGMPLTHATFKRRTRGAEFRDENGSTAAPGDRGVYPLLRAPEIVLRYSEVPSELVCAPCTLSEAQKALWKIAVTGYRRQLMFSIVRPFEGKPVLLADSIYFLVCRNEDQALFFSTVLNHNPAREFLHSLGIWTVGEDDFAKLKQLDIKIVAEKLNLEREFARWMKPVEGTEYVSRFKVDIDEDEDE